MIPFDCGLNPIYNILCAYGEYDPEIGYTQGMNYLAALLFVATGDEIIAFALLQKVMTVHNWRESYKDQLIEIVNLTAKFQKWLRKNDSKLADHLEERGVILEAQLSSPFMGLFANLVDLESALHVLDRFIFYGEQGILDVVQSSFVSQRNEILKMDDPFELQMYLTRQIYRDAIEKGTFLPQKKVKKFLLF